MLTVLFCCAQKWRLSNTVDTISKHENRAGESSRDCVYCVIIVSRNNHSSNTVETNLELEKRTFSVRFSSFEIVSTVLDE